MEDIIGVVVVAVPVVWMIESMRVMKRIATDVSAVRESIERAQVRTAREAHR